MQNLIPIILLAVALATALNVFLRRFNMPTVVGYIITGAIIGSVMHFDAHGDETLHHVAEFGIGCNHAAKVTGTILEDEKALDTCHIALGNNIHFGGTVDVPIHLDGVILQPEITIK